MVNPRQDTGGKIRMGPRHVTSTKMSDISKFYHAVHVHRTPCLTAEYWAFLRPCLPTEGLSLLGLTSYLCCGVALAVSFVADGCNMKKK